MTGILTWASAECLEFDRIYLKLGTYVQMGKKTQQMENKMSGCFGKTLCRASWEKHILRRDKNVHRENFRHV